MKSFTIALSLTLLVSATLWAKTPTQQVTIQFGGNTFSVAGFPVTKNWKILNATQLNLKDPSNLLPDKKASSDLAKLDKTKIYNCTAALSPDSVIVNSASDQPDSVPVYGVPFGTCIPQ
jgi:hypothetical protein